MKIGIDIRKIGEKATGEETYTRELINNLIRVDNENQYYFFHYLSKRTLEELGLKDILEDSKVNFVSWPWAKNKLIWSLFYPFLLPWYGLDIYHTGKTASFRLWPKPKIIITLHDLSSEHPELIPMSWFDRLYQKIFMKFGAKFFASKIITISEFSKEEITKFYKIKSEKVEVIYLGAPLASKLEIKPRDEEEILKKFELQDSKYLLYLGTLQPRKNVAELIKIFNTLKQDFRFSKLKLVIAGGRGANFDSQIEVEYNNSAFKQEIVFSGYITDQEKAVLLQKAEVFVFLSLYEGFGLPPLEAMAYGTPCIVSDLTSLPEVVGTAAVRVDLKNRDEIIQSLKKVLLNRDFQQELISKGFDRVNEFDWRKTAQHTIKIYKSLGV